MQHSVNLMAVCDAKKQFTYVFAGFPGSAHDARVFDLCGLNEDIGQNLNEVMHSPSYHMIGDSAFPLREYLLVPYKDYGSLSAVEVHYNRRHSKTRMVIENAFGLLKSRFRILNHVNCHLKLVPELITACCVLHNICIAMNDNGIDSDDMAPAMSDSSDSTCSQMSKKSAVEKRAKIARKLLASEP